MTHGFFEIISRQDFEALLEAFSPTATETLPLAGLDGRILASDVISPEDLPLVGRSGMDGFAVNARDTFGASETNPAYLENVADLAVDQTTELRLAPGECARIPTGGSLPHGADAVVMVEYTQSVDGSGGGTIEIRKSCAPGENVMLPGEDAKQGEVALTRGTFLRSQEIGLLAALGITGTEIFRRPEVGIISTGDELTTTAAPAAPGKVRDVNSHTLSALAEEAGAVPTAMGIVGDDLSLLQEKLAEAVAKSDVVFLSGGSSVGMRDLTVQAIEAQPDATVLAHGVALSPGKPTILARVGNTPVLGLPGQVTSVQVVMRVLVMPFLRHLGGLSGAFAQRNRRLMYAEPARNVPSKPGREDWVRVRLEARAGQPPLAHPIFGKSGLLRTLLAADGLMRIPADEEGVYKGAGVEVLPL